jgi:predicted metal-dependent hydrolase
MSELLLELCKGSLHHKAMEGFALFNTGRYFEAHEAFEAAWNAETGPVRELYRGILQAAVVYLHVTRCNYKGAVKVYRRSQKWLTQWPEVCRGVEVGRLRRDLDAVIAEVRRLGPEHLDAFDRALLKPVRWEAAHGTG